MTKNINLLPSQKKSERAINIKNLSFRTAVVFLCAFVLASAVLIAANIYILSQRARLESEMNQTRQNIEKNQDVEGIYLILSDKLAYIESKITSRFPYSKILKDIYTLLPKDSKLSLIDMNQSGVINMHIVVGSAAEFKRFTDALVGSLLANSYEVRLTDLSRNPDGNYSLTIDLGKDAVKKTLPKINPEDNQKIFNRKVLN